MDEVRHGGMAGDLDGCDDDEREIRLAELCGCGFLDPAELERTVTACESARTQEIGQNQRVRGVRFESESRATGERRAA